MREEFLRLLENPWIESMIWGKSLAGLLKLDVRSMCGRRQVDIASRKLSFFLNFFFREIDLENSLDMIRLPRTSEVSKSQ
jgi:hypothetical protein